MEIAALKRLLIQRINDIEDPLLLREVKRMLSEEGMEGHVSITEEGVFPYFGIEDRNYTAEEVRAILVKVVHTLQEGTRNVDVTLDADEWAELGSDHETYLKCEAKMYTWEQVREQIRVDRGR